MTDTNKKPGPKNEWAPELGKTKRVGRAFPPAIHNLLSEKPVQQLLNRMATEEDFKKKILIQVDE
jgi:hypothetical protein